MRVLKEWCLCRRHRTVCCTITCLRWAPTTSSWCDDICPSAEPNCRRFAYCCLNVYNFCYFLTFVFLSLTTMSTPPITARNLTPVKYDGWNISYVYNTHVTGRTQCQSQSWSRVYHNLLHSRNMCETVMKYMCINILPSGRPAATSETMFCSCQPQTISQFIWDKLTLALNSINWVLRMLYILTNC